ncbi:3' exoribonuclease family, domain 1-domain-containing protein [Suillus fuscotomentosus]|uniref:3' exoribonuclease family, domain 1-domain-containing protein n=1 Tax=Suillus fuscotomentosus TaxID=1912939 RepID=A0AAD4HS60_9AGAM|nr:3' exoribonuclease family, domain 1-domain-containing protein [Suillus fuscotomentosus]KAG1905594.1 3' exoribonuclease family, domain 1-domain-containing protein [Suillus fuscotomentosus]
MAQSGNDRRRINGPEESFPPVFDDEDDDDFKLRSQRKRGPGDIRPIFLQPGLISQANGSAYIETEKTKIACAVYGPRQSKTTTYSEKGRLNVEVKFAPFSCTRRRAPMRDAEDRSIGVSIHQAIVSSIRLELFPKSTIDVFITIIENDGIEGCIASGSLAASTALADAGIEMLGLVASCSAAIVGDGIQLDPTEAEARASSGTVILACMPALDSITSIWQSGQMSADLSLKCMEQCYERCNDIHSVVAQSLLEHRKTD